MTDSIESIVVRGDDLTVPLLVWRRFKRPMPGLVEAILDSNPGLAGLGPFLPFGTVVNMPIPIETTSTPSQEAIRLW